LFDKSTKEKEKPSKKENILVPEIKIEEKENLVLIKEAFEATLK
jgi:hypothetical protein